MKKINKLIFLLLLSVLFVPASIGVGAQNKTDEKKNIKQPPRLMVFDESSNYSLQNSAQLFKEILNPSDETSFRTLNQEQDRIGFTHLKMQQFYNNVKVEFGTVTLHSKNGMVKSMNTEFYPIQDFNITPRISNVQAFNFAISHTGAQHYMWEYPETAEKMDNYKKPVGELVIIPDYNTGADIADITSYKLAYKFDIYATSPVSRGYLYIDANNGQALFYDAIIKHADNFGFKGTPISTVETEADYCDRAETEFNLASGTAATRYSGSRTITTRIIGSTYALRDDTRGNGVNTYNSGRTNSYPTTNFTDADNNWTAAEYNNAFKDNAALDAHWGAEVTYDYWQQKHGRNSYNNAGAAINSYVHYDDQPGGLGYDNAFWNGSVMTYGDGSSNGSEGNGNFDALTSVDVAGHEIGHAVTSSTANLAYQRESGALNEGYSDIWGAAIEHFSKGNGSDVNPSSAVWLIGDEIDRRTGSAALRSMSNPSSLGQPDTYGGSYWINPNCGTPTQFNDYCGVHTNSGVLNYWFYLTVVGGSGTNDIGSAFTVSGIGMAKASAIAYRTLIVYLTSSSTFANARTSAIQAAVDLYGAGGVEEQAVTNAWYAVGVGAAYGGGGGGSSYCASQGNNVNDEYISRVQLNTINNTSGAQLYSDFTSISTSLTIGNTYTVTVTPTWTGTVYAEGYAVWIDYNNDKDFSDAGELVWSKAASTNTPNSGTFTVPSGTVAATTRMRVSMKYNGIPTACETFSYGEVEDYTVILGGSVPDTQAPTAPTGLTASNVTQTTVDLSWNASTDNVGVTGYDVYEGTTNLGTVTGTTSNITGLTAATAYSFKVRARDAAGNLSGYSNIVSVTTLGTGGGSTVLHQGYFETGWDGWVDGGSDAYRYTGSYSYQGTHSIRLRDNTSTSIMTLGTFNVTAYNSIDVEFYFKAVSMETGEDFWVQFFDGSTWRTVASYASGSSFNNDTFYVATVNIPKSSYNFPSNAQFRFRCDASDNYDYVYIDQVTITANSGTTIYGNSLLALSGAVQGINGGSESFDQEELVISPNPTDANLNVQMVDVNENMTYSIVNILGQTVLKGNLSQPNIDVRGIQSGVYFIEVNDGEEIIVKRFIKK